MQNMTVCDRCGKVSAPDRTHGLTRPKEWIVIEFGWIPDGKDFCSLPCLIDWARDQMEKSRVV